MLRGICLAVLMLGAGGAHAGPEARFAQGFDEWRSTHEVGAAIAVALYRGAPWIEIARGMDPDTPVDLQSNTKAITAQCLAALVAEGAVGWQDSLSDHLPGAGPVTLAALVTHTGGVFPDGTQAVMTGWRDDPAPRWHEAAEAAAARPRLRAGQFQYTNDSYALLGAVIEAVTGQDYLAACAPRVLAPAEVTAGPSERLGAYGPFGGLAMVPRDYAQFQHHSTQIAQRSGPRADLGGGASYGLGMLERVRPDGARNLWHYGMTCFADQIGDGGSFVVSWGADVTVFVAYDACLPPEALQALEMLTHATLAEATPAP